MVEAFYEREKKHKTGEDVEWTLDAQTPNREKVQEEGSIICHEGYRVHICNSF